MSPVYVSDSQCLALVLLPKLECQCKMAPSERKNCGYPGISPAECRKAGCCFSDSVAGVPWCFAPKAKKGNISKVCPNNPQARTNCGFPGISAATCERKGCCFRAQPAGVPWCFYPHMVEEGNRCSYQTHSTLSQEIKGFALEMWNETYRNF
uniref:P-type domain-containing protein n=1 Tax=Buteo japonicus TaxID=224669 RepID=A0A8C0C1E7_9AVES